ncbi:hypothetical protein [Acinetobacter guillouiae]|uniref:hypothetical protein n=1 Tax=Acinetobacter guillouiae TaxID=106649 RepID=UPI0028ED2151|nr:hypothetical protein [Acinetobacter guillouiae]
MKLKLIFSLSAGVLLTACSSPFETGFKDGCRNLGANRSFCSCSYNNVEQHYGEDRLKQIKNPMQFPEDWEDQVQQAGLACMSELN